MRQSYQHFSIALRESTDIPYFKYDTTPDHPCQMCSRPRDIGPTSGASWACRFRSPPGIRCTFFRACTRGTGEGGGKLLSQQVLTRRCYYTCFRLFPNGLLLCDHGLFQNPINQSMSSRKEYEDGSTAGKKSPFVILGLFTYMHGIKRHINTTTPTRLKGHHMDRKTIQNK